MIRNLAQFGSRFLIMVIKGSSTQIDIMWSQKALKIGHIIFFIIFLRLRNGANTILGGGGGNWAKGQKKKKKKMTCTQLILPSHLEDKINFVSMRNKESHHGRKAGYSVDIVHKRGGGLTHSISFGEFTHSPI